MQEIDLKQYNYELPDVRIAKFPLDKRDQSKLLFYQNGEINHQSFGDITHLIPVESSLFFNDTKVIPARIFMHKETGAQIEIFLLSPIEPSRIMSLVMEERQSVVWRCMIGNFKKWKNDIPLQRSLSIGDNEIRLEASIVDRDNREIKFEWDNPEISFAEIVEYAGQVPLPPYLNRAPDQNDKPRYQTVYSENEGAVAAPTAGLHFTDHILNALKERDIQKDFLTLHVSAGTFQPIKVDNVVDHPMHSEQIVVTRQNVANLLNAKAQIIAVGTTSMRTMESLFWFGARLIRGNEDFAIDKLEPYSDVTHPSRKESLRAVLNWMDKNQLNQIVGTTEIFIFPGYQFRVCDGLITNFHQPGSTLMLLVAALVGEDWKKIYSSALDNDYRFLSYGDSSLLLPSS